MPDEINKVVLDPGTLIIVGAVVSALVLFIKKYVHSDAGRITVAVVLSLIASVIYVLYKETALWNTFLAVLSFAGAIYTYIFRQLEKTETVRNMLGLPPR